MSGPHHFRRAQRARVALRAELRLHSRSAALVRTGEVLDLAIGGAYVAGEPVAAESERVWIRFVAATAWEPLELEAEVRWVEPEGFGVRFLHLSDGEAAALHALVDLAGFVHA
jgi:hypothetical protein